MNLFVAISNECCFISLAVDINFMTWMRSNSIYVYACEEDDGVDRYI